MVVPVDKKPAKIYVCHVDDEHDRLHAENVAEYLTGIGASAKLIELAGAAAPPELQQCLDDPAAAVLSFNAALDHSSLGSVSFLEAAERSGLPVLQWILDHPSARWAEFGRSTPTNSRFLLSSEQQQRYFETYCLPGALTAVTGGAGPNRRSRREKLTFGAFMQRPQTCLIPLNLHRARSLEQSEAALAALEPSLAEAVHDAVAGAQHDLRSSLHPHLVAALATRARIVSPETFGTLCRLVEESVQAFRRLKIFSVVKNYPALIQSDDPAARLVQGSAASLECNVGMQSTLDRMPTCRAVLGVSPMNDMIAAATANALNAGCLAIAEDNAANSAVFVHGENALLFRYDDDSVAECLDILCGRPEWAYKIAQAGMRLRDDPRIRFGRFHNIVELSRRGGERRFE